MIKDFHILRGDKLFKILVVEDDKNLKRLITTWLKMNKYETYEASNGREALKLLDKEYIDLIISDVMMPQMDGFELIKELRDCNYEVPILVITAKGDMQDKKTGFILGADDYMVKPIEMEELLLRVKAILKRSQSTHEKRIVIGDLVIDYEQMSVIRKGKVYLLAKKEFELLYKLVSSPNVIHNRQDLMEEIWGLESESDFRTVDVHIKRIREKLIDVDEFEIITIRGVGYKCIIKEV
mgnify:FL=1